MNDIPARASAVIVGAGIVGNSLACHLARLGWRDLVLVDNGPMPNPGGSTGHASNFIFPIEYSKMMMELTADSSAQYKALGVHTESGGIEVARTPARMAELRRRCSAAKAWAGSCTCRSSRGPRSGTRSGPPGGRPAWCRQASACTGPPAGWRRATGPSAPS
jgi:glycine/D-amino acid oxidase-like deaminating enzyme